VFTPQGTDDAELGEGRGALEHAFEALVFVSGEPVFGHEGRRDDGIA